MDLIINQNGKEIVNEKGLDDDQISAFFVIHKEKVILSMTMHMKENLTLNEMEENDEDFIMKIVVELK